MSDSIMGIADNPEFSGLFEQRIKKHVLPLNVHGVIFKVDVCMGSDEHSYGLPLLTRVRDEDGCVLWEYYEYRKSVGFDGTVQLFFFKEECYMVFMEKQLRRISLVIPIADLKHLKWMRVGNKSYIVNCPECSAEKLLDAKLEVTLALMHSYNVRDCSLSDRENELLQQKKHKGHGEIAKRRNHELVDRKKCHKNMISLMEDKRRLHKVIFDRDELSVRDYDGAEFSGKPVTMDDLFRLELAGNHAFHFILVDEYPLIDIHETPLLYCVVSRDAASGKLISISQCRVYPNRSREIDEDKAMGDFLENIVYVGGKWLSFRYCPDSCLREL